MDAYGQAVFWHNHPNLDRMAQAMRGLMEAWTNEEIGRLAGHRSAPVLVAPSRLG